jgi:hypothetical protein
MNHQLTRRRRLGRDLARAATAICGSLLVLTIAGVGSHQASAATAGTAQITTVTGAPFTATGNASTEFLIRTPSTAACAGDSANGGWRIQSYMVNATKDPGTLTFDSSGPLPNVTGATYVQPMFSGGNPYVNGNTAVNTGALVGVPTFDFTIWSGTTGPTFMPPGTYNVGLGCWNLTTQTWDRYWNVQITVASNASGITWQAAAGGTPTTTVPPATTTTVPGATTTTVAGATTTTGATGTTDSSIVDTTAPGDTTGSTDSTLVDSGAGGDLGSGGGTLVTTGSSPVPAVVWGILLLVFGRIAILLARPIRVVDEAQR